MFTKGQKAKKKEGAWEGLGSYPILDKNPILTVSGYSKHPIYDYSTVKFEETGEYSWDGSYFQAIEEPVKTKFQFGDKVVSVKDTPNVPEGFIGYITEDPLLDLVGNFDYAVAKENNPLQVEYFKEDELELLSVGNTPVTSFGAVQDVKPDVINSPKHYAVFEQVEAIQVIASSMTQEQFYGYCLGNILKYRLRAGAKDDVMQELGKADKYQELYTEHKHLCKEGK